jgi:hypothetical protein
VRWGEVRWGEIGFDFDLTREREGERERLVVARMLGLEGGNRKVGKSYNYTFILYETRERERDRVSGSGGGARGGRKGSNISFHFLDWNNNNIYIYIYNTMNEMKYWIGWLGISICISLFSTAARPNPSTKFIPWAVEPWGSG